jgi:hypothetical protein
LWAFEAADCSNPHSDGLLKIEPNTVRVFASAYDIKGVVDGLMVLSARRGSSRTKANQAVAQVR